MLYIITLSRLLLLVLYLIIWEKGWELCVNLTIFVDNSTKDQQVNSGSV